MAHKHLHELLKEDQEPFHLNSYIAERRSRATTKLQVIKRNPIIETSSPSSKRSSFYKRACFLSFQDSPDVRKSPFLNFPSRAMKSPRNSEAQNGAVLLQVPARTAALLLEAATRVQKQQSSSKPKSQIMNVGFGLFGSILKRLKDRSKSKKREVRNIKSAYEVEEARRKSVWENGLSCSCNNSRVSSAGWSESNEEKSLDLESSSSCSRSEDSLEDDSFADSACASCEKRFCSSPLSPFRFSHQGTPSPGRRTPDFLSPVASLSRHKKEEKEQEGLNNIKLEDEEKEQCSPVSVLDNPFEDDDDGHEGTVEGDDRDEDDYGLECSYAIVQRAKLQLLDKLCRFEKLAELDPIELEKRMVEEMDEEDYDEDQLEDEEGPYDLSLSSSGDGGLNSFITEVLSKSGSQHSRKIPADTKRLVSDLIIEEMCETDGFNDKEVVVRNVSKKLDSWKEVQSNTIDMMVQLDFGREFNGWKKYQEQIGEIAMEIESEILGFIMDELSWDLVN